MGCILKAVFRWLDVQIVYAEDFLFSTPEGYLQMSIGKLLTHNRTPRINSKLELKLISVRQCMQCCYSCTLRSSVVTYNGMPQDHEDSCNMSGFEMFHSGSF